MTRKTYCGNLLWQSGLTLLAPDISFERSRQLVARLLTNLGVAPGKQNSLYSGLVKPFDPYFYTYW